MAKLLTSSKYAAALPDNIARVILQGMTEVKETTISSPELAVYSNHATALQNDLSQMLSAFKKLGFDVITIPEGKVSVDVLIPRDTANDDIFYFTKVNAGFAEIISAFEQLVGLQKESPKLVYSSTSDLVTGLAIAIQALQPFLTFYNGILDAAKKHIDIQIGLKTLRNLPLEIKGPQDLDAQAAASTRENIETAVVAGINAANSQLDDQGMESELRNHILIRSKVVANAVINGARVGVTVESLITLPTTLQSAGVEYEPIKGLIEHNAQIGILVAENFKSLGQPVPLSLTDESDKPKEPFKPLSS